MAIQNEPTRIRTPFASSGTKNVIPQTMGSPSATAAASWQLGFPPVCSLPLSAGGIPPARNDFNGLFNQMTQTERFLQDGGVFAWDSGTDYAIGRVVSGSDHLLYQSVAQTGPNTSTGIVDPTTDASFATWKALRVPTMPLTDVSKAAVNTDWIDGVKSRLSFYVNGSTGNDSNDGTQSSPVKTIGAALTKISNIPFKQSVYYIHIQSGNYSSETLSCVRGVSVSYTAENGTVSVGGCYAGTMRYLELGGSWAFDLTKGGINAEANAVIHFLDGASISFTGNYPSRSCVSCSASSLIYADNNASVSFSYTNCTGDINFKAYQAGTFRFGGVNLSFSGSFTGQRYFCEQNSCIAGIGGANVIPGTTAGTSDTSSYFG